MYDCAAAEGERSVPPWDVGPSGSLKERMCVVVWDWRMLVI